MEKKRKTTILSLEDEGIIIEENEQLKSYIEEYYRDLFGREPDSPIKLNQNIWMEEGRINENESAELTKPFSMDEIESAVKTTK